MLSKVSIVSLALLAGVNAQGTVSVPLNNIVSNGQVVSNGQFVSNGQIISGAVGSSPSNPIPYGQYNGGVITNGNVITTGQQYITNPTYTTGQIIQQAPQQITYNYPTLPTAPVVQNTMPTGPQYGQYKRWTGKACTLLDLSLPGKAAVAGVIRENDLNGDLSCDTSDKWAASTAAQLAGTATKSTTTTADATKTLYTDAECLATKKATDEQKSEVCIAQGQATDDIMKLTAVKNFVATAAGGCKVATLKPASGAPTGKGAWTQAIIINKVNIAACKAAGIAGYTA
jgi:hypothetical protein